MSDPVSQTKPTLSPEEIAVQIRRWSWGAFFLNWIWGIGNRVWIALLALVPFVNIFVVFYLGFKGNELAWEQYQGPSVEDFHKKQKIWAGVGVGIFGLAMLAALVPITLATLLIGFTSTTTTIEPSSSFDSSSSFGSEAGLGGASAQKMRAVDDSFYASFPVEYVRSEQTFDHSEDGYTIQGTDYTAYDGDVMYEVYVSDYSTNISTENMTQETIDAILSSEIDVLLGDQADTALRVTYETSVGNSPGIRFSLTTTDRQYEGLVILQNSRIWDVIVAYPLDYPQTPEYLDTFLGSFQLIP